MSLKQVAVDTLEILERGGYVAPSGANITIAAALSEAVAGTRLYLPAELDALLESGTLALSSGPVRNSAGEHVATFNSIWRLEADGKWRIIFDKGSRHCPEPAVAGED